MKHDPILDEHNRVLPHSVFLGQTPDEMSFGTGGRSAHGPGGTRGRRAPSPRGSQSVGVLRDVPVTQRGPMMAWLRTAVPTMGLAHACASR